MIILSNSTEWDTWISMIRQRAEILGIWDLVNPNLPQKPSELPYPDAPIFPLPAPGQPVNPNALLIRKIQKSNHKILLSEYSRQKKAFDDIVAFIRDTISASNIVHIENVDSHPYEMLRILKKELAPTDQARLYKAEKDYQRICKGPKDHDVDKWLNEWDRIYTRAKELHIAETTGTRPVRDFLLAVRQIDVNFADFHLMNLISSDSDYSLDAFDLIRKFRNIRHFTRMKRSSEESELSYKGNRAREPPKCICGKTHWWADCFYLNSKYRPSNWKPDTHTQEKVNKALRNKNLKEKIDNSIKKRSFIEKKNSLRNSSNRI